MERELFSALVRNMKRGAQDALIESEMEEVPISLLLGALGHMASTLILRLPEAERRTATEMFVDVMYSTVVVQSAFLSSIASAPNPSATFSQRRGIFLTRTAPIPGT